MLNHQATNGVGSQVLEQNNSQVQSFLRQTSFAGIVSECSGMQRVFSLVSKVARTNSTVLILGESGTGKELIARALHKLSGRTGKLIPVNCGAIPEDILESELFGHEKGSFTGAVAAKIGRFQMAEGGTIFLDEIGEMSPKLQVKLLRVLQERRVEPVGATRFIDVDVRVIAATNKDLRQEVKAGRFREDLYYRLQVVPVELPALRNRGEDVSLLARYFMERACRNMGRTNVEFSTEALSKFQSYSWPGNVRELENLVERLAILSESNSVSSRDLPEYLLANEGGGGDTQILEIAEDLPEGGLDFNACVDQLETRLITKALERTNWNKKAAAKLLKLNRTTLVEKIKKKGLEQQIEVLRVGGSDDSDGLKPIGLLE
jgi:transcriptional regulator with GAF, ATPase, and Fis domain